MKPHGTWYVTHLVEVCNFFFPSLQLRSVWYSIYQDDVAGCFEYFADQAEALDKRQNSPVSLPMETFKCHLRREPIGVVGLITPWYFHFSLTSLLFAFMIKTHRRVACIQ